MQSTTVDPGINQPKYQQIIEAITTSIEQGTLILGQQLPSINALAEQQGVAKVTVAKAYEALRQRGIVQAHHGKGFYVSTTDVRIPLNVFVLFDTLNAYKETLYDALKSALPVDAAMNVFFHHYNRTLFENLIRNNLGRYNAYVIMPHFNEDVSGVVGLIPTDKLLLIDQTIATLPGDYAAIYQDFDKDVFLALNSVRDRLKNYRRLTLVLAKDHFQYVPNTLLAGFKRFGQDSEMPCTIVDNYDDELVQPGEAFLLFAERDLIDLIKRVNQIGLTLGQDVGLISYDDTPMKEILAGGITVISTDFARMGQTVGELLTSRSRIKQPNPSGLIRRQSL